MLQSVEVFSALCSLYNQVNLLLYIDDIPIHRSYLDRFTRLH